MNYKEISDDRFQFLDDFGIKVPRRYANFRQMRDFRNQFGPTGVEEIREKVYKIEDGFSDGKLALSSSKLTANKHCLVVIYQVTRKVACVEALEFLKLLGADLVGGQGVTVLWPQARNSLPQTRRIVSLDVHNNLPTVEIVRTWHGPNKTDAYGVDEKIGIPYIFRYSGDDVGFHFDSFDDGLDVGHCLACFKQEE